MPMTINVGSSKKIGLPDYGSLGASCNVEFEADHDLLDNPEAFRQRIRHAFAAAREAVEDELAHRQQAHNSINAGSHDADNGSATYPLAHANGSPVNRPVTGGHGANGSGPSNGTNRHMASEKQLGFAKQLAKSVPGLGFRRLEPLVQRMFGKPLAALSSMDASGLIDTLKSIKDGQIELNSILEGNAA